MRRILVQYRYEIIAALAGAVVMILELIGSRMMAPYFGTSLYVWTAIIGVILGALSFGYWYGGRLADQLANDKGLAIILAYAAGLITLTLLAQQWLLQALSAFGLDIRIAAVIAALFLFAPASCLLGIVSPYIVRLRLSSFKTAGASVGRLSAAGTIGSIAGTFLAGYWLIGVFGNFSLGVIIAIGLIGISFIAHARAVIIPRVIGIILIGIIGFVAQPHAPGIIADIDSSYARYQVRETTDAFGTTSRYLLTDNQSAQSGIIVGRPGSLAFEYTTQFNDVTTAYGSFSRALVIGGGAFTFPAVLADKNPASQVDVVEIDPRLKPIAQKYFEFQQPANLSIIPEDGRVFLNQNTTKYDLIYIDAFSSLTPPYQLATVEAAAHIRQSLSNTGVMVVNLIAAPNQNDVYYLSTLATYNKVFPRLAVYQANSASGRDQRQNLIIVAGKDADRTLPLPNGVTTVPMTQITAPIFTDDHAPVEQRIQQSEHTRS